MALVDHAPQSALRLWFLAYRSSLLVKKGNHFLELAVYELCASTRLPKHTMAVPHTTELMSFFPSAMIHFGRP